MKQEPALQGHAPIGMSAGAAMFRLQAHGNTLTASTSERYKQVLVQEGLARHHARSHGTGTPKHELLSARH